MKRARTGYCILGAIALAAACSNDWDRYDPRLGTGGGTGTGGAAGGAAGSGGTTSGGASGSGGTTSGGASGSGGTTSGGASGSGGSGGSGGTGGTPSGGGGTGNTGGAPSGGGGTGNTGGTPSGGGGTGGTGATGGGGTGGTNPITVTYLAKVADCVDTTDPNPDVCEAPNPGLWTVDLVNDELASSDAALGPPTAGFLRFDLDNAFAGKTVTKIELVVRVGASPASSDHSGEVWTVSTFTRPDLFKAVPAKVAKVATDLGAVAANATVKWTLPNNTVSANTAACFGVFTSSTNGADYQNTKGSIPPRLLVTYQ